MFGDAATASCPSFDLRHSLFTIPVIPPLVMGVINVTPDSFSDGGECHDHDAAVARAMTMISDGAAIIDVGPESTRPGSRGVSADEQIRRAIPVIESIRSRDSRIAISIDTCSAAVARAAVGAGADMINDTSALRDDPALVEVVAEKQASVVLMHRRGMPATMQENGGPAYGDILREIGDFLCERREFAVGQGIAHSRIVLDPGIGFGKRTEHNLTILRSLDHFVALGQPLLVGVSRKRFIGAVLGLDIPRERDAGSLACAVMATLAGVSIIRTHDVRSTVQAVRICNAIRRSRQQDAALQLPH